ncbi:MAG: autotransporter-associated beta strand repeat-containing protein, partial [Kiritimatiellae bacterium]|nr:autotransporter-associated beta strand repeat-containing protein [Kiritimatiellia bacterium]
LGGASQTITTPIDGNNTGFFRDGCEIRNGTLTIDPQTAGASIRFKDTTITVGPGANVSGVVRVDLNNAHFVIDGGTFTSTYADRDIGNHPIGRTAASSIVLRNGGRFVSASELWIGFNANGTVVGNDSEIDLGSQILYMSINGIESVLALTNSTLTCGWFRFGYSGGANPGVQTVSLKDTIVNVTKFVGTKLNPESSLLFDGATLVPKAAATDFMPASANLPTPTIGAGGLTVSNAYDVTIAKGLAGAGGLVKKGDGALTLSGPNTFTGGIDVQAGALAIAGDASFANTMLNMADGTTLKVKFSPGSGFATSNIVLALDANTQGSVAIEIDLSTGMPEPNRVYTLFAPGLNAATQNRLSIDPAFSPAFSENGALTLTFSPKIHAWMGGGADAKWTTAVNWNISDPIVTYDHVVFSGISGYSIYDCADGLRLASITAGFGVHTANVETACFANVPITVAGGATFALENASGVTNAFSTVANTNVIAGVLDLGGAAQTISTTMAGNDAGSFRDGGEIRNGALTLISSTEQNLNNTAFTFGSGSRVSSSSRIYLQYGAHLTIDGGTYTNTFTGNNHVIGANSGVSTLEVSNGGCFVAKRPWFIGHTANGSLIGDGGIIDVGAQPLYLSNQNAALSVLALTNAVLTCGEIQFAYSTSGGNTQTLILKNSLVNLSSFLFRHKTAASSILFDGATLVPKAASASFIPTGLPTPVLGAGGLIISNAFDVSVAVGMTGEGGIVKKGNAKLTVTGNQSFVGDVIVSNGTFTTSSEFAGGLRAMSDATIDVADAMFGGDIVIEDGVALTATNGVDWATTKFVPIAKTTANASYPSRADADGRHFFVRQQGGVQTLCYGRKAGLVIMMR